jgi:hypothetical protein
VFVRAGQASESLVEWTPTADRTYGFVLA